MTGRIERARNLFAASLIVASLVMVGRAEAACPVGTSVPVTSGTGRLGIPLVFSFGPGGLTEATFFALGAGDENNSGVIPIDAWVIPLGDLDGDGRDEYRIDAPGSGAGGWGDPAAAGCPATLSPPYPPLVLLLKQDQEDNDRDGAWDVFEDFLIRNDLLDVGEDLDHDGRLTPRNGCEGFSREDQDCDGHLDFLNEDADGDGRLDPGEDRDGDGHLDLGTEDRNHSQSMDDRPFPQADDVIYDYLPGSAGQVRIGQLPPYYPYTRLRPLEGGFILASVAWSGAAYDFDAVNIPARLVTLPDGRQFRIIDAPATDQALTPRVSSARVDFVNIGTRLRVGPDPTRRIDDVGGRRTIFDRLDLTLAPPPNSLGEFFLESGSLNLTLPGDGGFFSITAPFFPVPFPLSDALEVRLHSTGSDTLLGAPGLLPAVRISRIQDQDLDVFPLPNDTCPAVYNLDQRDFFLDGIGDACDPSADPSVPVPNAWTFVEADTNPGLRQGAAAAFDAARGVTVLFGGSADSATWEYDGVAWTRKDTDAAPDPRSGHRMVYDDANRRVLLFGGTRDGGGALNDLWQYDGRTWSRIETRVAPPPRFEATEAPGSATFGMAYDSARRQVVLFGGDQTARTWVFDGLSWKIVPTPRSPLPRSRGRMAYDPVRHVTVLQGGYDFSDPNHGPRLFGDTWEFDGATWQEVDARGDYPPSWGAEITFDPARRRLVGFGGEFEGLIPGFGGNFNRVFYPSSAIRAYDGTGWSFLPARPPIQPQALAAAAFDLSRGVLVVQGSFIFTPEGDKRPLTGELLQPDDSDGDGFPDARDDCPLAANPDQADSDRDGFGDACDDCRDLSNPTQHDLDRDGLGDACDGDIDGDGVANRDDACPAAYVAGRPAGSILGGGGPDSDGDGTADDCDACPGDPNNDADRDGIRGDADNCPATFNPLQEDSTHDGSGDACQPFLTLSGIEQRDPDTLVVTAVAGDPDGDPPGGTVDFFEIAPVTIPVLDLENPTCDGYLPQGIPGQGIGYFASPTVPPLLYDIDFALSIEGLLTCSDGQPDYMFARGRCPQPVFSYFPIFDLTGDLQAICLAPYQLPPPPLPPPEPCCPNPLVDGTDLTVLGLTPEAVQIGVIASTPALHVPFAEGLPRSIDITSLRPGFNYRFVITVTDGRSVPVSAETTFLYQGESVMLFEPADRDGDGVLDDADNCLVVYNPGQENLDGDTFGDVCDPCTDTDGDGWRDPGTPDTPPDSCPLDNCPSVYNPGQADCDGNGVGDACEPVPPPCAVQAVSDVVITFNPAQSKGSGLVSWRTSTEITVVGFNVVVFDSRGRRIQQNRFLIPCKQCSTGKGTDYAFVIPKHKSGRNVFVEMICTDDCQRLWGPAVKR
jgi:hypothetical protein